ncbi:TetR family transcriptional regulator [Rhodococcus erythropolis]|uniref:TetR family transcriptional regulator n=1 Tax=Rhodococcus erythropolis TaxID=1833 RepID=UPI00367013CF
MPSGLAPATLARHIQPRAIATRAAILAEAAKALESSGYSAASIYSLIASPDLTKGAIFHHFSSKRAIAQQLVQGWTSAAEEAFPEAATTVEPSSAWLQAVFLDLSKQIENDVYLRAGMKLTLEPAAEGAHQAYRLVGRRNQRRRRERHRTPRSTTPP